MSQRAKIRQSEIVRAIRAAKQAGAGVVEIKGDAIIIHMELPPKALDEPKQTLAASWDDL